jgi:hypothetical protein
MAERPTASVDRSTVWGMACSEGERIMADEPREGPAEEHEPHPTGTVILMLLFIVLIIVLWGYMYLLVLGRGATQ